MLNFAENLISFKEKQKDQQTINFDSNSFKKNILFDLLLQELQTNKSMENFKTKVLSIINNNETIGNSEAKTKNTRVKGEKVKAVIINKEIKSLKDTAEALVYTTERLLSQFDFNEIQLLENTNSWLTNDIDILGNNNGYFKFYKEVIINNNTYYIGTNTNSSRKYIQIEELCTYLKVPHELVYWYTTGEGTPVFGW
jgi:negative regulator of replication initiation